MREWTVGRVKRCFPTLVLAIGLAALAGRVAEASGDAPDPRHVDRSEHWERTQQTVLTGFKNMYHPMVLRTTDPEYPYRMWFFGWAAADCNPGHSGCDAIYLARGKDLEHWEVYCGPDDWEAGENVTRWRPVLTAQDLPYDAWHNGDPSVVWHGDRYYMAYSATGPNSDGIMPGQPGDADGELYCVMGATSPDGIHWTRSKRPVLMFPPEVGAQREPGQVAFHHGMYHRPSLLIEEGRCRLWFDYWNDGVAMGYAEGNLARFLEGGFTVLRAGDSPVLNEWPNPSVVRIGSRYYAFSDPSGYGVGWPGRQLAEAVSDDGLNWRILGWLPPDSDTPACQVPTATVLEEDDAAWLVVFYSCQVGGDPYDFRYDRIRYMRRRVGTSESWTFMDSEAAGTIRTSTLTGTAEDPD